MLANAFIVETGNGIALVSVTPNSGLQSQRLTVTITGQNTHFVAGTTQVRFGSGIMVGSGIVGNFGPVTVTSSTTATAQITIIGSALPASRTVTAQTGSEVASLANGFTVLGIPAIISVNPPAAHQGQIGTVTITGQFTHFVQGTTQVSFGSGVSVGGGAVGGFGPVTVNSPASITASISVDPAATLGQGRNKLRQQRSAFSGQSRVLRP
jgi:hypothetical protein